MAKKDSKVREIKTIELSSENTKVIDISFIK